MRAPALSTIGRRVLALWLVCLMHLAGPARAQDATTIAQARNALEAARSTRAVRAYAAPELNMAEFALERALTALEADMPRSEIEHLAYLAQQRAAIAQMYAEERQSARRLETLSATRALILEARVLETAADERRARELAQQLERFDARADEHGLLLTPRVPWFETGLMPARRAVRAIAEAASLLGKLPERDVVVTGYAAHAAAGDGVTPTSLADRADLGCARADVVRAFLISNGVDPRRIVATCIAPQATRDSSATATDAPPDGETTIAILPEGGSAWTPTIGPAMAPGSAGH
jgi:outer membrane protein OmpA-like peptidoglycan-associated protein